VVPGPLVLNSTLVQFGKTYRSSIRPLPRTGIQWVSFIKSNPELSFFCPRKRRNKNLAFPIKFPALKKRFKKSLKIFMSTGNS
jgi:hypothetical protein